MYRELLNNTEKKIVEYIKANIEKRYTHIMETRELSIKLAEHYLVDVEKSSLAALLHDISKHYTADEMRKIIYDYDASTYPSYYTGALLHAKTSKILAIKMFLIEDIDVLNAVERHTAGCTNMTMLDKILFAADYLEPSRKLEIADLLREKIFDDFDYAFEEVLVNSIKFLVDTKRFIDYNSIDLYNSIVLKK